MTTPEHAGVCGGAAAYVLGALPPADRHAFEDHLAACASCRATVADLAGVPGLLARVSADDVALADASGPPPETVLPRLLREVRRHARVRRAAVLAVAAAALVALVVGIAATPSDPASPGVAMTRLVAAPISASVALRAEGDATRLDMTCRYEGGYPDPPGYHLVVTGTDGSSHDLAQWRVGPDGTTRVVASVDLPPEAIRTVEVRTASGRPLLRLAR